MTLALVPVSSVEAGKYIYQGTAKSYTQITVTGKLAQHSALPQNSQVIHSSVFLLPNT